MGVIGSIISWAIFGLIVGAIARLLMPGRQPLGIVWTMVLGVVGSLAGGMLSWLFVGMPDRGMQPAGWIMSILGAVVMLWLYAALTRPRTA